MTTTLFLSLQGLGNSILNFPILSGLKSRGPVEVVCFDNGSSRFFSSFHDNVLSVPNRFALLKVMRGKESEELFSCYPTWRRELASVLLTRSNKRHLLRPDKTFPISQILAGYPNANIEKHDIENNLNLVLPLVERTASQLLDLHSALKLKTSSEASDKNMRVLAIHPTASSRAKFYPLDFWTDLLTELTSEFTHVRIFSGFQEQEVRYCQSIKDTLPPTAFKQVSLHAGLAFSELAQNLYDAEAFVGSDSAVMHLAALLDKPLVALWSFADYRRIYPYGNHSKVYIPKETVKAKNHSYPHRPPGYLDRAEGAKVADILLQRPGPDFIVEPNYKDSVAFYVY